MTELHASKSMADVSEPQKIADTFGRKAALAIAVSTVGFGVAFVGSIVVARLLGAEGKGTFSLFMATVIGVSTFAGMGIDKGQMYHAARSPSNLDSFLPNGVAVSLVFGGGTALLYFLLGHLTDLPIASPGVSGLIAGVLLVPTVSVLKFQKQYLITTHHYVLSRASMAVQQGLPLIAVITLYPIAEVQVGLLIILVAAGMLLLLVCLHFLMRHRLPSRISLSPSLLSWPFAKASLWFGFRHYLSDLTLFLTKRLDYFLVVWWLDHSALGVYSVAGTLAEVVVRIPRELGVLLFPVFASKSLRKGQAAALLRRMNLIALALAIGLGIFADPLIPLLFGTEFVEAVPVFRWLLLGTVAWSTIEVTWSRVSASGRPGLGIPIFGASALLDAALNAVLLPRVGIVGAGVAATASYVLAASSFLYLFCKREGCSMSDAFMFRLDDIKSIIRVLVLLPRLARRAVS